MARVKDIQEPYLSIRNAYIYQYLFYEQLEINSVGREGGGVDPDGAHLPFTIGH